MLPLTLNPCSWDQPKLVFWQDHCAHWCNQAQPPPSSGVHCANPTAGCGPTPCRHRSRFHYALPRKCRGLSAQDNCIREGLRRPVRDDCPGHFPIHLQAAKNVAAPSQQSAESIFGTTHFFDRPCAYTRWIGRRPDASGRVHCNCIGHHMGMGMHGYRTRDEDNSAKIIRPGIGRSQGRMFVQSEGMRGTADVS